MKKNVIKNIVGGVAMVAFAVVGYASWDMSTRASYACRYAAIGEPAEKAIAQLRASAAAAGAKVTEMDGRVTAVFDWFGWEMAKCTFTHKEGRVLEASRRHPF